MYLLDPPLIGPDADQWRSHSPVWCRFVCTICVVEIGVDESIAVKAQFYLPASTPPKLPCLQTSNLARLITSLGECHKGVNDVAMTSQSKINFFNSRFLTEELGVRLKRKPVPNLPTSTIFTSSASQMTS